MSEVEMGVINLAPADVPAHVAITTFGVDDSIELKVAVSDRPRIKAYGFAFGGTPVIMKAGKGVFFAAKDQITRLEWVMIGDPGGTMKVVVTRGGAVIEQRDASEIVAPFAKGYDAFDIKVS